MKESKEKLNVTGSKADSNSKKEKITYIDDGRSLADMSGVQGSMFRFSKRSTVSSYRAQWQTYWSAVKMMFLPMLVTVGFLLVAYLIMALIFGNM